MPDMFPESSVLAIDGKFSNMTCNIGGTDDPENLLESGFMIAQTSSVDDTGKIVTVQEILCTGIEGDSRRELYESIIGGEKTFPDEDSEAKVTLRIGAGVMAKTTLLRKYTQLWGEGVLNFEPYVDFAAEFAFRFDLEIGAHFLAEKSVELIDFSKEIKWLKIPVPNAGFALPEALTDALNVILPSTVQLKPAAGISVTIPATLNIKAKAEYKLEFDLSSTLNSGTKAVEFGLKGRPSGLVPSFFRIEERAGQKLWTHRDDGR
jgi:hypothetical protein